jgi:DNA-binding response OmpR family regulator
MMWDQAAKYQPADGDWSPLTSVVQPKWVLVADDEPHLLRLVQFRLERRGLNVLVARDGAEALDCARTTRPDLCLLDIAMPKLTGFDVLQALRLDAATANMRVVMLTAMASDRDVERGYALGADDYITKPFSPRELMTHVYAQLGAV